jgi:hypothetical protein
MKECFSLDDLYVLIVMGFQGFGLTPVRHELADQCAYEVFVAMMEEPELKESVPKVYAWRCHTTEDGKLWHYPQDEVLGLTYQSIDNRHIGGSQFEQQGLEVRTFCCLMLLQNGDAALLEQLVARVIRPYILEEANLRSDFERDLREAERGVAERYKEKAQERFRVQQQTTKQCD